MTDKFILMGLDDEKSKKVAEVLGNATCKKIINCLADANEASEKDISDALEIKLNTVEYNLKKLLDSGLVEKTKNFFWSKKGKKIPMYKLAKKHIIISPKSQKPKPTALRAVLPLILISVFLTVAFIALLVNNQQKQEITELNKFNSLEELNRFLEKSTIEPPKQRVGIIDIIKGLFGGIRGGGISSTDSGGIKSFFSDSSIAGTTASGSSETASDYSETNIQVEGVDEADIVKNDGKYIYTVSGNKLVITDAYPAEDMEILSEINFNDETIHGIFINGDNLVVFSSEYGEVLYKGEVRCMATRCVMPSQESQTNVYIYDISDRENPEIEETFSVSGNYHTSRMIGKYAYIISNQYINDAEILPAVTKNDNIDVVEADEIYYSDIEDTSFQYTIVLAVNVKTGEASEKVLLTGIAQNIYVSENNIYTTYTKQRGDNTAINKLSIDKLNVKYITTGEIPGHVLNQFSMDEYKGDFRIATTIGRSSSNNVYILDENLDILGKLENLAEGESIYSVRFVGERGYVVTFKKVDPLFVIDLSNPENPIVLGKLKIPGYSDYLHPYDENHIIGIGKDTVEADGGNFAWYQGIKMAIFDVSDVENPIELHKVIIGDRGTDSYALQDHKAFLFDKEKELLVLPIRLVEEGESTFQGAYVYNINLEDGFDLKGRVTHYNYDEENEDGEISKYGFSGDKDVQRALYMDETLYTISNSMIKANNLNDLVEISYVEF